VFGGEKKKRTEEKSAINGNLVRYATIGSVTRKGSIGRTAATAAAKAAEKCTKKKNHV